MPPTNKRNKTISLIPVILAGGSGSRLWPISRKNYPKSFLKLSGDMTLLQNVVSQIKLIPHISKPLIIGNIEYGTVIEENIKEINTAATILLETESRNTAAATAIAAQYSVLQTDNPLLLILPIDHFITNFSQFSKMVIKAIKLAMHEKLVIFGVSPNSPATDYGYIKKGDKLPRSMSYAVKQFKEKPDSKKAAAYLKSGKYYWNSGIFLFSAATFLEELALHSPRIFSASKKVVKAIKRDSDDSIRLNTHLMKGSPSISLDEAILEKTKRAIVFPFKGNWHDLGNWKSLYDSAKKDKKNNAVTDNVVSFDTSNSYLYTTNQLLVTSGVSNFLVVVTKDAVLVAGRYKVQDIKKIVNYLIWKKHTEAIFSPVIYKAWGFYEVTHKNKYLQIKHFYINYKKEFFAKTKHRYSTWWIVIKGKAQITIGKKIKIVSTNESIEITPGMHFYVKNLGDTQLNCIEICNSIFQQK